MYGKFGNSMGSTAVKDKKADNQVSIELNLELPGGWPQQPNESQKWTRDVCPVCGYGRADVDPKGVLWCPACGYSKKGCYT
jgi:rubrerythrin